MKFFGAQAAAKLRKQLAASKSAKHIEKDTKEPATHKTEQLSESTESEEIWLCFPCMQKHGEKSARIDNDGKN